MLLEGASIRAPSAEHKVLETSIEKSESAIVVRAGESPAHMAKGWQIDRAKERNNDRTQHRRTIMVNET